MRRKVVPAERRQDDRRPEDPGRASTVSSLVRRGMIGNLIFAKISFSTGTGSHIYQNLTSP
jgi:hypothetical protein